MARYYIYAFLGGVNTVVGAVFMGMYFWEAIIVRVGEADQSLKFWYLPLLFLGMGLVASGIALLVYGVRQIGKQRQQTSSNSDNH